MNNTEFLNQLAEYIDAVYENEGNFISVFAAEKHECDVVWFCMEKDFCFVKLADFYNEDAEYEIMIEIDAFFDWFDGLKHENNTGA